MTMNENKSIKTINVLAFSPHPDDAEIGCGGLLLKLKSLGYSTGIIDLTKGEFSTSGNIKLRQIETSKASKILNLDLRINLNLGDCLIKKSKINIEKVVYVIRKYKPLLVLIPYFIDRHPDHENSYKLLKESIFFAGLLKYPIKNLAIRQPYRPSIVINYMLHYQFNPSFIVDITDFYHLKMKACRAYKSQLYRNEIPGDSFNNKNSSNLKTYINSKYFRQMIYFRDKFYGLKIKCDFGEPYFIEEEIKIDDPVNFFKYLI